MTRKSSANFDTIEQKLQFIKNQIEDIAQRIVNEDDYEYELVNGWPQFSGKMERGQGYLYIDIDNTDFSNWHDFATISGKKSVKEGDVIGVVKWESNEGWEKESLTANHYGIIYIDKNKYKPHLINYLTYYSIIVGQKSVEYCIIRLPEYSFYREQQEEIESRVKILRKEKNEEEKRKRDEKEKKEKENENALRKEQEENKNKLIANAQEEREKSDKYILVSAATTDVTLYGKLVSKCLSKGEEILTVTVEAYEGSINKLIKQKNLIKDLHVFEDQKNKLENTLEECESRKDFPICNRKRIHRILQKYYDLLGISLKQNENLLYKEVLALQKNYYNKDESGISTCFELIQSYVLRLKNEKKLNDDRIVHHCTEILESIYKDELQNKGSEIYKRLIEEAISSLYLLTKDGNGKKKITEIQNSVNEKNNCKIVQEKIEELNKAVTDFTNAFDSDKKINGELLNYIKEIQAFLLCNSIDKNNYTKLFESNINKIEKIYQWCLENNETRIQILTDIEKVITDSYDLLDSVDKGKKSIDEIKKSIEDKTNRDLIEKLYSELNYFYSSLDAENDSTEEINKINKYISQLKEVNQGNYLDSINKLLDDIYRLVLSKESLNMYKTQVELIFSNMSSACKVNGNKRMNEIKRNIQDKTNRVLMENLFSEFNRINIELLSENNSSTDFSDAIKCFNIIKDIRWEDSFNRVQKILEDIYKLVIITDSLSKYEKQIEYFLEEIYKMSGNGTISKIKEESYKEKYVNIVIHNIQLICKSLETGTSYDIETIYEIKMLLEKLESQKKALQKCGILNQSYKQFDSKKKEMVKVAKKNRLLKDAKKIIYGLVQHLQEYIATPK